MTEQRAFPHNFELEMALLGILLTRPEAFDRISDIVRAEHFADPRHGEIFRVIADAILAGRAVDPVGLYKHFEANGQLEKMGGPAYLAQLAAAPTIEVNAPDYARAIRDHWLRRVGLALLEDAQGRFRASPFDLPAEEAFEALESDIFSALQGQAPDGGVRAWENVLQTAIEQADAAFRSGEHISGVPSGLAALDRMLGGFKPGQLIIVAGRPSMGKSAFGEHVAFRGAPDAGWGAMLFSPEMSAEEHGLRFLAQEVELNAHAIRSGYLDGRVRVADLVAARERHQRLPIVVDDTAAIRASQIRLRARRQARQWGGAGDPHAPAHGLGAIVVDYLQLMQPETNWHGNRVQEVSEISRALKSIAKDLAVPVIALCQLSREVEKRSNKRPQLADLRESGQIEQDADVVILLYRKAYYLERDAPNPNSSEYYDWESDLQAHRGVCEAIVAKHRGGPVGTANLAFDAELTRFGDQEPAPPNNAEEDAT